MTLSPVPLLLGAGYGPLEKGLASLVLNPANEEVIASLRANLPTDKRPRGST